MAEFKSWVMLPECIRDGLKGHPRCEICQCYPECRRDCPDWKRCYRKMREYWTEEEKRIGCPKFDLEMG